MGPLIPDTPVVHELVVALRDIGALLLAGAWTACTFTVFRRAVRHMRISARREGWGGPPARDAAERSRRYAHLTTQDQRDGEDVLEAPRPISTSRRRPQAPSSSS